MKKYIILIMVLCSKCLWAQTWSFVGPKSDGVNFVPERAQCIADNPFYVDSMYVGSRGGVWVTGSAGAPVGSTPGWTELDPNNNMLLYSGASSIIVGPSTHHVYIASTDLDDHISDSKIWVYDNQTSSWSSLNSIASGTFIIHNILFYPGNESKIYACTSIGLYYSANGGSTWTSLYSSEIYNLVFILDGGTEYGFATGDGTFLEASNGVTFTDNLTVESLISNSGSWTTMLSNISVGNLTGSNKDLYILSANSYITGTTRVSEYDVFKVTESGGVIGSSSLYTTYNDGYNDPDRLALQYIQSNGLLFYGGLGLNCVDTKNGGANVDGNISVHSDQHFILDVPTISTVLVANDGSFYTSNYSAYTYSNSSTYPSFTIVNTGLDICQITGFSGAGTSTTKYVTGEQDREGKVYDFSLSSPILHHFGNENNGGIVSKFTDLIIGDNNSEDGSVDNAYALNTGGTSFSSPDQSYGIPSPYNAFVPGTVTNDFKLFGTNTFSQDPSRPNKIYFGESSLDLWDVNSNKFLVKLRPFSFFSDLSWYSVINGIAINPYYYNSMYCTVTNRYAPPNNYVAQVLKFTGTNIDDCWMGHNEGSWSEIKPDLSTISFSPPFTSLGTDGIYQYYFPSIVVSTWDPNKIWVACSPVPNNPQIKVLQYFNGSWTDYSTGIPTGENVTCMVMEIGSNDGIYLGTNRAVYYRNPTMSSWQLYNNATLPLPEVTMHGLEINYNENALRAGTFGRGIWKSGFYCPSSTTLTLSGTAGTTDFDEAVNTITSSATIPIAGTLADGWATQDVYRAGQSISLQSGFYATPGSDFIAYIHPCAINTGTNPVNSVLERAISSSVGDPSKEASNLKYEINVYPNPNNGSFTLNLPADDESTEKITSNIYVYNLLGALIYTKTELSGQTEIDLSNQPKGTYFVKAINNKTGETDVKKVMVQ